MKICVTSQGDSLDSATDPRFGRCAWFVFVDPLVLGAVYVNARWHDDVPAVAADVDAWQHVDTVSSRIACFE